MVAAHRTRSLLWLLLAPLGAQAQELSFSQDPLPRGTRVVYSSDFAFEARFDQALPDGSPLTIAYAEVVRLRFRVEDDLGKRLRVDVRDWYVTSTEAEGLTTTRSDHEGKRFLLDHSGVGLRVYRDGHLAVNPVEIEAGATLWSLYAGLQRFSHELGPLPVALDARRDLTQSGDLLPLDDGLFQVATGELRLASLAGTPREPAGLFEVRFVGQSTQSQAGLKVDLSGQALVGTGDGVMRELTLHGPVELGESEGARGVGEFGYHHAVKLR